MSDIVRMSRSVRFYGGTILRQYDEVERYDSRTCVGRFPDAAVDAALKAAKVHAEKYGSDPDRKPAIVIHCGRLHVVEEGMLTTEPRPAPTVPIAVERPAPKQKALF